MDLSPFHPYHRESEILPSQLMMPHSHLVTTAISNTTGGANETTTTEVPRGPDKELQNVEVSSEHRSPSTDTMQDAKLQAFFSPGAIVRVDNVGDPGTSHASPMNPIASGGSSSPDEPSIAKIPPGSIAWANLRTWGWWPGRVANLNDFRPNKRKYASMRAEKEKRIKAFVARRQQQAAKAPKGECKDKGSSKKAKKPDLLLVTFYGDSTWSWMTRDKVAKMSREPRKDPEYLEGLEKAKKMSKKNVTTFNKAIEEALEAFASDMALESDSSPPPVLGGDGSSVATMRPSPGLCAAMLPDTNLKRENGARRRAGRSNASSSIEADDPFTAALKLRQAALGLTQIPENEEKHGLTPAWVVTVAVKVFGLEIVGGKPEWLKGPPNGERPAPLDSSNADEDRPASGPSPLPSTLDAVPDATVTLANAGDPARASPYDPAIDGDTQGKAVPCAEHSPCEGEEQRKTSQGFEKAAVGTDTIWSATEIRKYEEACAAVGPEEVSARRRSPKRGASVLENGSLGIDDSSGAGQPQPREALVIRINEHLQSGQEPSSRHHGLPDGVLKSANGTMNGDAGHEVGRDGTGFVSLDSFRGNDVENENNGGFMGPPEVNVFQSLHRTPKRPASDEPSQPGKRRAGIADKTMSWSPESAACDRDAASMAGENGEKLEDRIPGEVGPWETPRTYFGFLQTFASMASGVINWVTRFPNRRHGQDLPGDQTARGISEETLPGSFSAVHISRQQSMFESEAIDNSDCLQVSGVEEVQDSKQRLLCCSADDGWPAAKAENQIQNELLVSTGTTDEASNFVCEPLSSVPEHGSVDPMEVAAEIIPASGALPWGNLPALQPADDERAESSDPTGRLVELHLRVPGRWGRLVELHLCIPGRKREGALSTRSQRTHTAAADGPRCGTCYFCKRPSLHHKCLNELVDAWTKPRRKYKPRKPKEKSVLFDDEEDVVPEPEAPPKDEHRSLIGIMPPPDIVPVEGNTAVPSITVLSRPEDDIVIKGLLDPSSNSSARPNIPAEKLYTVQDDGLDLRNAWDGYVFLNPPFDGNVQWRFINRVIDEVEGGRCKGALLLCRGSPDTNWWPRLRPYPRVFCRRTTVQFLDYPKTPIGFGVALFCLLRPGPGQVTTYQRFFDLVHHVGELSIPMDREFLGSDAFTGLLTRLHRQATEETRDHWMQCDECGQWRRVPYKMWLENESSSAPGGTTGADCLDTKTEDKTSKPNRKRKVKRWTCDHIDPGGCQSLCVRADMKWRYGALDDRRYVAKLADLSRREREQLAQQPPNHRPQELQPLPQTGCEAQGGHRPDDPADSPGGEAALKSGSNEENSVSQPQDILTGQDTGGPDDSGAARNDCSAAEPDAPTPDSFPPTISLPIDGGSAAEALDSNEHQDALSNQEAFMPPRTATTPAAAAGSEDTGAGEGDMHQNGNLIEHAYESRGHLGQRWPEKKSPMFSTLESTEP